MCGGGDGDADTNIKVFFLRINGIMDLKGIKSLTLNYEINVILAILNSKQNLTKLE